MKYLQVTAWGMLRINAFLFLFVSSIGRLNIKNKLVSGPKRFQAANNQNSFTQTLFSQRQKLSEAIVSRKAGPAITFGHLRSVCLTGKVVQGIVTARDFFIEELPGDMEV